MSKRSAKQPSHGFGRGAAKSRSGSTRNWGKRAVMVGSSREAKFFDTALSFFYDLTGEIPVTGQLVLIPQGVTESTRVGRKAFIQSIQIQAIQSFNPSAAGATNTCYLYLVQDTQANKAAAGVGDVLSTVTMHSAVRNLNNSSRFNVIKRWVTQFDSGAGVAGAFSTQTKNLSYYHKFRKPIAIDYNSTAGVLSEITQNNLFLMAGSSTIDDVVNVLGTCRVRYTD